YDGGGKTILKACVFIGNEASDAGAGFAYEGEETTEFTNCVLANNLAGDRGGAIYHDGYRLSLTHSTLVANSAPTGGGLYHGRSFPLVLNSIIYGNGGSNLSTGYNATYSLLGSL